MKVHQNRKLYLPAVSIVAIVVFLLVITGISTFRNLDRAEKRAVTNAYRQGSMLLRTIESGARAGMHMPMWGEDAVERLLYETGKDDDIVYIYLVNRDGSVAHHSNSALPGESSIWSPAKTKVNDIVSRMRTMPNGSRIFEVAKPFKPFPVEGDRKMHHHRTQVHQHDDTIIVIGLSMRTYDQARTEDTNHAFFMAGIIITLGTGGLFFLFVIQNYYLVGRALRQTQDYAREVMKNMADGLIGLDSSGRILTYNPKANELLGIESKNLSGNKLEDILDFDLTGIRKTLQNGKPTLNREYILTREPNEEPIPLSLSVTPIKTEEDIVGAVILIKDLRNIKRLENKLKRAETLAAIGELAASIAHEIRNPLSSIKGFAQFLLRLHEDNSEAQEYTQLMIGEVDRINGVVEGLLFFSRPAEPNIRSADVADLCNHCVRLVQADADLAGVVVESRCDAGLGRIDLDGNQITQALLNLLLNALDAVSKNGHIIVAAKMTDNDRVLEISVEDNGTGISPDLQDKFFEPFYTTKEKGTGLGLSIVKKVADAHDATILVQSPPAGETKGSRFIIKIPIVIETH